MRTMVSNSTLRHSFPWMTWLLVLICLFVYAAINHAPVTNGASLWNDLIDFGALAPNLVWSGEIWRVITAIFIHANFIHLTFSLVVFLKVGKTLEGFLGPHLLLFVFLASGCTGFALSLLFNSMLTLGASGAVFGVIGALVGVLTMASKRLLERRLLKQLILFVILNIVLGVFINIFILNTLIIDFFAHIGGLASGFFWGVALSPGPYAKVGVIKKARISRIALALSVSFSLVVCILSLRPVFLPKYHLIMGQQSLFQGNLSDAKRASEWLQQNAVFEGEAGILAGRVLLAEGKLAKARRVLTLAVDNLESEGKSALEEAIGLLVQIVGPKDALFADEKGNSILCDLVLSRKKDSNSQRMLNNCAWLILNTREKSVRDPDKALFWSRKAVEQFRSTPPEMLHTLAEAYWQKGQVQEAMAAIDRALVESQGHARDSFAMEKRRFEKGLMTASVTNSAGVRLR